MEVHRGRQFTHPSHTAAYNPFHAATACAAPTSKSGDVCVCWRGGGRRTGATKQRSGTMCSRQLASTISPNCAHNIRAAETLAQAALLGESCYLAPQAVPSSNKRVQMQVPQGEEAGPARIQGQRPSSQQRTQGPRARPLHSEGVPPTTDVLLQPHRRPTPGPRGLPIGQVGMVVVQAPHSKGSVGHAAPE
jgi:hypothetical protein